MKTQAELRAEFRRLFEADLLEEADAILEQIEPPSGDEWQKMHDEAPIDDEPLSDGERRRLQASGHRGVDRATPRAV